MGVPLTSPKRITTGYTPRTYQAQLHKSLKRFNVIVCHRRFGKTVFALNEKIDQGLRFALKDATGKPFPNPRYAYLAPLYGQAKRVAWDYLKMYTAAIPGVSTNEADLRVDIPRPHMDDTVRFTLLGADNPSSLKGIYLDGCTLDEYAEMNPSAWSEVIRPTLSDRKGWANFIGTPKGQNNFYKLYKYAMESGDPEWFSAMYKASETGIIDPAELESAKRIMTEEEYLQEYECDWGAGMIGAYFTKDLSKATKENRITEVPYDERLQVDTYWDLGMNDVTSIWFIQSTRFQHRLIRYLEGPDKSVNEWIKDLKNLSYNYGLCVLPHDAKAREQGTGKSLEEQFRNKGIGRTKVIPRVGDKRDSINAARMLFSRCFFDKTNCSKGLEALSAYRRRWDEKTQSYSEKPLHDWASNCADSFQTFAMGVQDDGVTTDEKQSRLERDAVTYYNPLD